MEMPSSLLEIPKTKKKNPFSLKDDLFCFVGDCPYFLIKDLDKVSSKQLRSHNPADRKEMHNTLPFYNLVCRNIVQP